MGGDELRKAVERRAHQLWEAAGCPPGRELEHWLQAEEEIGDLSAAGEEDPGAALDDIPAGLEPASSGPDQVPLGCAESV